MRAGPLSKPNVIENLNRFFVPVYVSMEDYADQGSASGEEKAEYRRIYREAAAAKLSVGSVHAYVLSPDGHPIDSLHVAKAAQGDNLNQMLDAAVTRLKPTRGEPLVKPAAQAACPLKPDDGSLSLHVVAQAQGTNPADGSWHAFPGEDWVVLSHEDAATLLPPAGPRVGDSWDVDHAMVGKVLTHFYPQTENNAVSTNRIDRQELKATVVSLEGGHARARLKGTLRMKHTFYPHREDTNFVDAALVGYVDFDLTTRCVLSFNLVTENATYGATLFEAVASSQP
jgi:hypothetical protein